MFWIHLQLLIVSILIKPYTRAQRRHRVGTRMKDRVAIFAWNALCC